MSEIFDETDEQREIIFESQNGWVEWASHGEIEWEGPDISEAEKDLLRDYEKVKRERDAFRTLLQTGSKAKNEDIKKLVNSLRTAITSLTWPVLKKLSAEAADLLESQDNAIAELSAFVGDEIVMSDYQTATQMRHKIERLTDELDQLQQQLADTERERDSLRDSLAKTIRQRDEAIASMSVAPMTGRQLSAMWVKHFGDCDGAWDALAAHIWPNQQPQPNQHEQLTSEKAAVQLLRTTAEFVVSDLLAYIDIGHPEVDNWAKKYRGHFQYRATDFPTLGNAMDVLRVMLQATAPEEDQHSQPDRREQLRGRVKRMDHGDCVVILELESKVAIAQDSIHGICWSCPTETGLQYVKSKSEAIAAATEWLVDEAMKAEKID